MQKRADWVGAVLALLVFGWLLWANRLFFHDDAYISLRYARNFALHGELVWNLGERVEGYTNFLHVILSAGLIRLGLTAEQAARGLNLCLALSLFPAVLLAARRLAPGDAVARGLVLIAVGATPGLAIWVLGGLEASMAAALIGWGVLALIIALQSGAILSAVLAGAVFSLAVLTRLDSAVFIAGCGLATLVYAPGQVVRRLMMATMVAGIPAAVALLHMAWRLDYYGLPFPLTFYAKTGVPLDWRFGFLSDLPIYVLYGVPVLFLSVVAALASLKQRGIAAALAIPLCLQLAYVIWSGGDHMAGGRVLVPLTVPAAIILLTQPSRRLLAGSAAVLSVTIAVTSPPLYRDPAAFVGALVGSNIAGWPPGQTISLATAGATPFHATDHAYIDQLGLNTPAIARRDPVPFRTPAQAVPGHSKGDGAYILSQEPDVIILGPAEGTTVDRPLFLSDVELAELPEFLECYAAQTSSILFGPEFEKLNPEIAAPIQFTWYQRTCPKSE